MFVPSGGATDLDFGIQCRSTGQVEPQESIEMVAEIYELEILKTGHKQWFQILCPYYNNAKIIDGVRIIENIFGRRLSTSVADLISLRSFCNFSGTEFEFLQYLGSAVTHAKAPSKRVNSVAVVDADELRRADIEIPDGARLVKTGFVILASRTENT
jgi:hypothetical protein